jgi:hypothetical protein
VAEVEGDEGVAVEGAERQRAAEDDPVDGAREERAVGEVGKAGARELGHRGVRVVGEDAEGAWVETPWLRRGGEAAGTVGGGGEARRCSAEAGAAGVPGQLGGGENGGRLRVEEEIEKKSTAVRSNLTADWPV